jgi:hypothetical protein
MSGSTSTSTERNSTIIKHVSAPNRSIKIFDGQDYAIWAIHMKDILRERRLLKYLEPQANITNYDNDEDLQAIAEIRFTLANNQIQLIMQCDTTHDAWEKLKSSHVYSSESNLVYIKQQFLNMKMKDGDTIKTFASQINNTADQISSMSGEKVSNLDKSLILTRGIPEKYRMKITAMEEMNKLSDYDHVVTSLTNEELRINERKKNNDNQNTENAFYSQARGQTRGRGNNRGNRGGTTNRFEGNCNYCGIKGHKEFEC